MSVVYFRGTKDQARAVLYRLRGILAGRESDPLGIGRGVFLSLGFAALSDIKADFITKSRGGTGEDGVKWPPLTKEYLAYGRRFGKGEQAGLKKAAGLGKGNRFAPGDKKGLLTRQQLKRWRQVFAQVLRRMLLSMDEKSAKARAAQAAWVVVKREGAKTKLEVFGSRQVEINRDTGILFNSLSPGEITGTGSAVAYTKPSGDGGEQQIFQTLANGVIVGTNVAYAAAVNKRRPFLPVDNKIPDVWLERWAEAGTVALAAGAKLALEAAA